jgi:hypothetical protein
MQRLKLTDGLRAFKLVLATIVEPCQRVKIYVEPACRIRYCEYSCKRRFCEGTEKVTVKYKPAAKPVIPRFRTKYVPSDSGRFRVVFSNLVYDSYNLICILRVEDSKFI